MKIAFVGSREFEDKIFAIKKIQHILIMNIPTEDSKDKELVLVSGGARGIDSLAEEQAKFLKVETKIFLPNWNRYGKRAGFLRNELIIDEADRVIAFWDGKSKGTKHSIDLAIKANKPLDIYVR